MLFINTLKNKIKKALKSKLYTILEINDDDHKTRLISDFGNDIDNSTFYIDKYEKENGLTLGTNVVLDEQIFSQTIFQRIQATADKYDVLCSSAKNSVAFYLEIKYDFMEFNSKEFLSYVDKLKFCIQEMYDDIQKVLDYHSATYIDFSMFENADWSYFDPYLCVFEKNKYHNNSWDQFMEFLADNGHEKMDMMMYVKICQEFEQKNNMDLSIVCDYVLEQMLEFVEDEDIIYN